METSSSLLEIFTGAFPYYLDFCAHELTHPSWDNLFYAVPAVCLLTFLLEVFLPHKQAYPLVYIPVGLIGFSAQSYFIFHLWSNLIFGFFSHCNIRIRWGFLSYVFINPDTHYWHHAKGAGHTGYGVNLASILPVWDLLFGTFYLPKDRRTEPELGLHRNDVPDSFIGQFLYPFRALLGMKKPASTPAKKTAFLERTRPPQSLPPETAALRNRSPEPAGAPALHPLSARAYVSVSVSASIKMMLRLPPPAQPPK